MEDQNLSQHMDEAFAVAIKIGELVQHRTIGVGVLALQSSLKAILLCADPKDRPPMLAAIMMFLAADLHEDDEDTDHSIH
jgi:hypothetical protein